MTPPAAGAVVHEGDVEDLELVEEVDVPRHALLEQRLQDHVARAVGGVAGPHDRRLAVVAGVPAEAALVDLALWRPVERQAEVLELDDRVDRLAAHDLRGRLVDEVVAALDRVEEVPLPAVLLHVGQRGAHAALRRPRVGPGRVQLRDHCGAALPGRLDGCPEARTTGADDHGVVAVVVDLHWPESCHSAFLIA
jgi:hypothetical protein